ncbi:MAG: MoaD/ThiS family protein [Desulfobacterales bacterium]|jgi:molybdopterin converting factor small subunit|nr:MoaD/ThiS family protein [Desulfobacterales bacterium]
MDINLKCFATLAEADTCDYKGSTTKTVAQEATVRDLLKEAKIAEKDVKLIFVNGKRAEIDTVLRAGDQVGLAPPVGGM